MIRPARDEGNGTTEAAPPPMQRGAGVKAMLNRVAEMRAFAAHYSAARIDRLRLSMRDAAMTGAGLIVAGILAGAAGVVAIVLVLEGLTDGLTLLLDGRVWAAELIVGVVVLVILGAAGWLAYASANARLRRNRIAKYEARKTEQRLKFGRDVDSAAGTAQ